MEVRRHMEWKQVTSVCGIRIHRQRVARVPLWQGEDSYAQSSPPLLRCLLCFYQTCIHCKKNPRVVFFGMT